MCHLEDAEHGGPVERAVVLPPPAYHRLVEPGHVGQRHVCLAIESPAAHRLTHPLQGIITGRQEAREELVLLAVSLFRPGGESQEGEADVRMLCDAIAVLAVNNLLFNGMHRQPTARQP